MKRVAVITGSFDPITTGHVELIRRASQLFSSVVVLVCQNFDKKYLFSPCERVALCKAAVGEFENVSVEYHDTWLYEYFDGRSDAVLVKGVRDEKDFLYEREMADFNLEKGGVETLLIFSSKELSHVSSTRVRLLLEKCGEWRDFIPQNAQKLIEKFYAEK